MQWLGKIVAVVRYPRRSGTNRIGHERATVRLASGFRQSESHRVAPICQGQSGGREGAIGTRDSGLFESQLDTSPKA